MSEIMIDRALRAAEARGYARGWRDAQAQAAALAEFWEPTEWQGERCADVNSPGFAIGRAIRALPPASPPEEGTA